MVSQPIDQPNMKRHIRLVAGAWFAIAAAIPTLYYYTIGIYALDISLHFDGSIVQIILLSSPIIAGGLSGAFLGARILDSARVKTNRRAAWLGVLVATLAFVLDMTLISWIFVFGSVNFRPTDLLIGPLMMFLLGTMYVAPAVGWLLLATGAIAGWGLYAVRRRIIGV